MGRNSATRQEIVGWLGAVGMAICGAQALAQDSAAVEAGEQLYEEHCQTCHGEKLRSAGVIPDLRELGARDREKFDRMVNDGRGQMPAWQGIIGPEEIDQLWAYVRSRGR
ncbi:MAG: cytochrome c [Hyphomicrobiales bacterium]|nr:cytochrome c [Hyphomicrobiales bacterium]